MSLCRRARQLLFSADTSAEGCLQTQETASELELIPPKEDCAEEVLFRNEIDLWVEYGCYCCLLFWTVNKRNEWIKEQVA